jgi:hypothetical protein
MIFLFTTVCLSLANLHSAQNQIPDLKTGKSLTEKVLNQQQELIDQQVEDLKNAVKKRAIEIMAVNPCDATLDNWVQAGECAADAFQLGEEALADTLMEWIKITFRALVAQDIDAIMESTLNEKLKRGEGEDLLVHGKIQDEIRRSENIMRTRGELAAQAQLLGYKQLADDILSGNYIQSPCIQLWNIAVTLDLKGTADSWLLDSFQSKVIFKDVPIYFWDPELELSPMFSSALEKGTFTGAKFGWYDGEDWIKGTAEGQPVWEIEIFQWIEDRSDYQNSSFIVNFNYAPFATKRPNISNSYTPNVIIKYPDGETVSLENVGDFTFNLGNDTEIRIPNEKLQKGKPITIEATNEDANYIGVAKFEFIPARKLKWKEKQK